MWAITLNFHQATHVSPIQNVSYQQSPEKTKKQKQMANTKRQTILTFESLEFIH